MHDPEVEARLRSMFSARAETVNTDFVDQRSPLTVRDESSHSGLTRKRLVGVLLAAAAVVAVAGGVTALQHSRVTPSASLVKSASSDSASKSVTYVKLSGNGGAVWIPSNRSGRWELTRPDLAEASKTEEANCAAFSYFRVSAHTRPSGTQTRIARLGLPTCEQGSWAFYRPSFAAALPTDPQLLLALMRRSGVGTDDTSTFVTGYNFLSTGWVEPRVVSNIVDALKLIRGVEVTQGVSNAAGVTGDSITYSGHLKPAVLEHWTLIVNPRTSQVIGTKLDYPGGSSSYSLTYRQVRNLGDTH